MAWVPIEESSIPFSYFNYGNTMMADSIVSKSASTDGSEWEVSIDESARFRITALEYAEGPTYAEFDWYDGNVNEVQQNEDPTGNTFSPSSFDGIVDSGRSIYYYSSPQEVRQEQYAFLIEVWEDSELVANDDEATTPHNTPVTIPVLANDTLGDEPVTLSDLAGPPTIVTQPPVGTATVNADGTITYTPPPGFSGEVEFQYRIDLPEPDCPELFFSNSVVPAEDVEMAAGEPVADNIYFQIGGITFNFDRTIDEEFWPSPGNYMPCDPLDWDLPEFPWQVDLYWGDGGGGVCVSITNGCS